MRLMICLNLIQMKLGRRLLDDRTPAFLVFLNNLQVKQIKLCKFISSAPPNLKWNLTFHFRHGKINQIDIDNLS